jgi:hypothetical protein
MLNLRTKREYWKLQEKNARLNTKVNTEKSPQTSQHKS